jgi:phenylacetate-CoA ligase
MGSVESIEALRIIMSIANRYKSTFRSYCDWMTRYLMFGTVYSQHIHLCRQVEEGQINVERYQRTALCSLLKHALTTVPFYRENYQINVDSISADNAYEALQRFDYLDKSTVMASPQKFISNKYRSDLLLSKTSGGSTGQGIRVFYNRRELGIERAYIECPWYRLGFSPWALLVQANANTRRPYKDGPFGYGIRRVYLNCDHTTSEWMPQVVRTLCRLKPSFLHGFPSAWVAIALGFRKAGMKLPVKGVLLCSEQVFPEQISLLQEVFGPVHVGYGQSERAAIAYGDLENGEVQYKLVPTYSYTEIAASEYGLSEIVGTNLFVKTMPLIRYRTQDLGKLNANGTILSLDGRKQETLVTLNGHRVPATNVRIDPFVWDHVESYQFVQNRPGVLELHIVRKDSYNEDIEKSLLEKQISRMGKLFDIEIIYIHKVENTKAGKQRLIVSNLEKNRDSLCH